MNWLFIQRLICWFDVFENIIDRDRHEKICDFFQNEKLSNERYFNCRNNSRFFWSNFFRIDLFIVRFYIAIRFHAAIRFYATIRFYAAVQFYAIAKKQIWFYYTFESDQISMQTKIHRLKIEFQIVQMQTNLHTFCLMFLQ